MAKTETFKGTIETAYGDKLATPLAFSGEYEHLTSVDEIPADEKLSTDDILAVVNNKRKANARQAAMNAVLSENNIQKPTLENNPQLQLRTMIKTLRAAGRSEAEATALAENVLGVKLAS